MNVGDNVVTSGIEQSDFPEGLSVGQVTEVEPREDRLGTVVRVKPWTGFGGLEYVTVLKWVPGQGPVTHHHDDHDDHDGAGSGDHDRAGARGRIRG